MGIMLKRMAVLWLLCNFVGGTAAQRHPAAPSLPRGPLWLPLIMPASTLSMKISPDGRHLVSLENGSHGYHNSVLLIDAQTLKAVTLVRPQSAGLVSTYTREPLRMQWINDDLLAVDFNDDESESIDLKGKRVAKLGARFIRPTGNRGHPSDWVLAYRKLGDPEIAAVNARTGERRRFEISLSGALMHWAFDSDGNLRAVTMRDTAFWTDETKVRNWYRANPQSPWELMQEVDITQDHWVPLHVPAQNGALIVLSHEGRDTSALFRFDTRSRTHADLLAGHPKEDIVGATGLDQASFDYVVTDGLIPTQHWFDPRWAALQKGVDAALPGRLNVLSGDKDGRVLVFSSADVEPGRWYLLDTKTYGLTQIAEANKWLQADAARPTATLNYRSLDGLEIPAYLTLPDDAGGSKPLVVLIHGGPHARDEWGWDEEVQVLAANGYAVFQPQFRGSTGFGHRFQAAGYGQWGLAMQDDITAGVQHLVDRKIADPRRICIVGASYGGYAALWGLVKTPTLYRCGVSFAGVSDIAYMLRDDSDSNDSATGREIQRARIGDKRSAEERFDSVSPLKQVHRIRSPVLVMHGREDRRVPIAHSERMVGALKASGKEYEWLSFPGEGHGLSLLANRRTYYDRLLTFLAQHLLVTPPDAGVPAD